MSDSGPRDNNGRFVPTACPICDCGTLQPDRDGWWCCDGLADPGHESKPLEACAFMHRDGDPYEEQP
jgi:hypothetical protein